MFDSSGLFKGTPRDGLFNQAGLFRAPAASGFQVLSDVNATTEFEFNLGLDEDRVQDALKNMSVPQSGETQSAYDVTKFAGSTLSLSGSGADSYMNFNGTGYLRVAGNPVWTRDLATDVTQDFWSASLIYMPSFGAVIDTGYATGGGYQNLPLGNGTQDLHRFRAGANADARFDPPIVINEWFVSMFRSNLAADEGDIWHNTTMGNDNSFFAGSNGIASTVGLTIGAQTSGTLILKAGSRLKAACMGLGRPSGAEMLAIGKHLQDTNNMTLGF